MVRIPLDKQPQEEIHRSAAVICGDLIYIDGVQARDLNQETGEQTADILQQLKALLQRCGSRIESLIRVEVTLRHMSDFAVMNSHWNNFVDYERPPGRACLSGNLFPEEANIQMSAVALRMKQAGKDGHHHDFQL